MLACLLLDACVGSASEPQDGTAARTDRLYVIAGGWHTEIAMPVASISGPLRMLPETARARYLVFGWGQRNYFMAANPGLADLLQAGLPGPSVMRITPLGRAPAEAYAPDHVTPVAIASTGSQRLSNWLWSYLEKDASGAPLAATGGQGGAPSSGSRFYDSTGRYSIAFTCNTWTAEAMRVAGLPVDPNGIVFARGVIERAQALEARPEPGTEPPP